MLTELTQVASVLAGLATLMGLVTGLTKSVRLRRHEEVLRGAWQVADATPAASTLEEIHRATVAELVARRLTPTWILAWPIFVWLGVALISAQMGRDAYAFLNSPGDASLAGYISAVFGGGYEVILFSALFGALSWAAFAHFRLTLLQRAAAARAYFLGLTVHVPGRSDSSHLEEQSVSWSSDSSANSNARMRSRLRSGFSRMFDIAVCIVPALLAASVGFAAGVAFARQLSPEVANDRSDLPFLYDLTSSFVLMALVISVLALARLWGQLRQFPLPNRYPVADERREAADPSAEAKRVTSVDHMTSGAKDLRPRGTRLRPSAVVLAQASRPSHRGKLRHRHRAAGAGRTET